MIFKLACKNLLRNRRRTFFTGVLVCFGVVVIVYTGAFLKGMFHDWAMYQINGTLGAFQIEHSDYREKSLVDPLDATMKNSTDLIQKVERISGIVSAFGELRLTGIISAGNNGTTFAGKGVDVEGQRRTLTTMDGLIREGRPLMPEDSPNDVILGQFLAEKLAVTVGDQVIIAVRTMNGVLDLMYGKVVGIKHGNHFPSNTYLEMHLNTAQDLLKMRDRVSQILVRGDNYYRFPEYVQHVRNEMANEPVVVRDHTELISMYATVGGAFKLIAFIVGLVLFIIVGGGIGNSMFMAVRERKKEIGTILAIGMDSFQVRLLFLFEGGLLGLSGALSGVIIALSLSFITCMLGGIPFKKTIVVNPQVDWNNVGYAIGMSLLVSVLASWLPASSSAKLDPVEALSEA